jgi:hypothetical protein
MIKYTLLDGSSLGNKLSLAYINSDDNKWCNFIRQLDENIIEATYNGITETEITFMHEEELTFFILRWS